ncbi:uncharacterized protein J3D65DRAFT_47093 [Phyllosticta citribraziliensis]|uniref:Uncharacterized protein n=1 Tax=Phyllosticta citribraziliensis TaxID=989973 RepID=A0ABR1MAY7_9PEZI
MGRANGLAAGGCLQHSSFSFHARSALALSMSDRAALAQHGDSSTRQTTTTACPLQHHTIHSHTTGDPRSLALPRRNGSTQLSLPSKHRTPRDPRGASARSDCSIIGAFCLACFFQSVVLMDHCRSAAESLLANGGRAGTSCHRLACSRHDVRRQLSVF